MESQDVVKNMQLFKESTWRTLILEEIEREIKLSTDILTWDITPKTDMNTINKNEYDVMRAERSCWIDLKNLPDRIINSHSPAKTVRQSV